MDQNQEARIIGFDGHPDSFTAAMLIGQKPADAICLQTFNKIPMSGLATWANKHTRPQDTIVLEASGNSFQIVRDLAKLGRKALVVESRQMGQLKDAHANNDKLSAVRIAKAYLAGTAKRVWVPDPLTQQRRDLIHAYLKAVKRSTQMCNRLQSYLSDNGVRLKKGTSLMSEHLRKLSDWSPIQWMLIENNVNELKHAHQQTETFRRLMAEEVIGNEQLLGLTRLCGIREVVAFALTAFIGDIKRFSSPKALVNYIGLKPSFDHSGEGKRSRGIAGGHRELRTLLIESGQSLLRSKHPVAKWGRQLMARKGSPNIAVTALARKLVTAVWYYLSGKVQPLTEIDERMSLKIGKMITQVGSTRIKELGKTRAQLREEISGKLKISRTYVLEPAKKRVIQPQESQCV